MPVRATTVPYASLFVTIACSSAPAVQQATGWKPVHPLANCAAGDGGGRVLLLPDRDGDGWPEVLIGLPPVNGTHERELGLRLYSGKTGKLLSEVTSGRFDQLGAQLAMGGGPSQETQWIAAAAPGVGRKSASPVERGGEVWILRASDLSVTAKIVCPEGELGFGAGLSLLRNPNAGGREDLVIRGVRAVHLASAKDWYAAPRLITGSGHGLYEMRSATVVGDVDHDGGEDLAIGSLLGLCEGEVLFISGSNARKISVLHEVGVSHEQDADSEPCALGEECARIPDCDGDGTTDLLLNSWCGDGQFMAWSFAASKRLWIWSSPAPELTITAFGAAVGDLDSDGVADLAMISACSSVPARFGQVLFLSGKTGRLLQTLDPATCDFTDKEYLRARHARVQEITTAGDVDRDGFADLMLYIANFSADYYPNSIGIQDSKIAGMVVLVSGKDGHALQSYTLY